MGALRTLRRKLTKERVALPDGQLVFADLLAREKRVQRGTPNRNVLLIRRATPRLPLRITLHFTKGYRNRREAF